MPETPATPLQRRIMLAASGLCLLIALSQILQTTTAQWQSRPEIACDQGMAVHQHAKINANRVNIRDLPTVFSSVLRQVNSGEDVTVVCVFGAWSQVAGESTTQPQWISSGLITPEPKQPLAGRTKLGLILMALVSAIWLALSALRPTWLPRLIQWVVKTDTLPPHAQPLIKKADVAVPYANQLGRERI